MLVNEDSEGFRIRSLFCLIFGYFRKFVFLGEGNIVLFFFFKDSIIMGLEKDLGLF